MPIPQPILYDYAADESDPQAEPGFFEKLGMTVKAGLMGLGIGVDQAVETFKQGGLVVYTGSSTYKIGGKGNIFSAIGDNSTIPDPKPKGLTKGQMIMIAGGLIVLIALIRRKRR